MKQRRLGRTGLVVSEIGLGTMTFGSMADEAASLRILDLALRPRASTSSTPPRSIRCRRTRSGSVAREEIVGKWLAGRPRDSVFVATKIAGPLGGWFQAPLRHGKGSLDRHHVARAVRGEPAPPRHRLRRPLPDALARHERADRGDARGARPARRGGEGPRTSAAATRPCYGLTESLWKAEKLGTAALRDDPEQLEPAEPPLRGRARRRAAARERVSLLPYSPLGARRALGQVPGRRVAAGRALHLLQGRTARARRS